MSDRVASSSGTGGERHGNEWNAELCACGAVLVGCHGCLDLRCLTCDPYTEYERLNRCCVKVAAESGTGHDAARKAHTCSPPTIGSGTVATQPDWTCGVCGRMWRDCATGYMRWWAEIRGPFDA